MNTRRLAKRILVVIATVFVCLCVIAVIVVNTGALRRFLISEIRMQALQRYGARVEIGSLKTSWRPLGIELDSVAVRGQQSDPKQPPLAEAKSLEVGVRFWPLLKRRVELSRLILDAPVVRIRIDANGASNFPVPPIAKQSRDTVATAFDLEIGDFSIRSGEIYYNDAETPLDAELHDLKFQAGYSILTGKYTGSLSYDNGRIASTPLEPLTHGLQLQFAADRSGLSISRLVLTTAASEFTLNARLNNYAHPVIDGIYSGNIFTGEVVRVLRVRSIPEGEVSIGGSLGYHPAEQKTFLQALEVVGHLQSGKLSVRTAQKPLEFRSISAGYDLKNADLTVSNVSAAILGGRMHGSWEMAHLDSTHAASRLEASLQGLSLTCASDALAPQNVKRIPVTGMVQLNVKAAWNGSIDNLTAHVQMAVANPKSAGNSGSSIPLNGLVQADYDAPNSTISFGQSYLQTSSTQLSIGGTLSSRRAGNSNIAFVITTSDLREVGSLATLIETASSRSQRMALPELDGSASLRGIVTGTLKNPQIHGQLAAENLAVDGSHWKSLALNLNAQPSGIAVQSGVVEENAHSQITFSGGVGLQRWSLSPNSPISLQAKATNLSLAEAQRIALVHYPISGTVSATVAVKGTRENPEAHGSLTLVHGSAWNEPINSLAVTANSSDGAIHSTINLQTPAGNMSADGSYQLANEEYQVHLRGSEIQLAKIVAIQRSLPIQGTLEISASGMGTIQNPQLNANLSVPQLQIQNRSVSAVKAQVSIASRRATVTLNSTVDKASVQAKGDVDLSAGYYANASIDVRALPVAAVLSAYLPTQASKIGGETEIHATLKGPLANPSQLEAHLEIPSLNVEYEKAQLALAQPLRADYRGGEVIIAPTRVQGTGTNLTFGGTIPIRNASAYAITADGSMDLGVLQQFASDVHTSGQVIVHLRSQGVGSGTRGELQLKNAVFSTDSVPVGVEGLNARVNFSGDRADIESFSGTAGGGTVTATGSMTYGHQPSFNLALNARSVRIRYPEGLRSVLSGQVNLQGNTSSSSLTGRVLVDRLSFTQAFDLSNFAGYFSGDSSGEAQSAFERGVRLNVAVLSAQDLDLASSKLSMGGSANLTVIGTMADPVLLGRIALTNGEVFFLSKRFEVQSGTIEFANPARTEPVLNLHITTTVEQYNVTLSLSGPIQRLKTNYTSDPSLPPADIIHLLAFGNTVEEAASAPSSSMTTSAESVLAQGVSSQVAGKIENVTGISQLTIDPLAANSQGNPGAQIAIQERVTGSLLLTFSTDVTETQSKIVELQYQLNKRLSLTILRDQNGGYGIDLRLHKEF